MDNLFKRFKDDKFSISELEMLRNDVANMTDEELSAHLDEFDCCDEFSVAEIEEIQRKLNTEIRLTNRRSIFRFINYIVAAAIIGIFIITGWWIYTLINKCELYEDILSEEIHMATQLGETVNTILPDGSRIELGPHSDVKFKLGSFNNVAREISFSGEGNFKVTKNDHAPFIIHSTDFDIKVLGTIFSVLSRGDQDKVEVHLEEGSVDFITTKHNKHNVLKPGETAVLDKKTGVVKIYREDDGYHYCAGVPIIYFKSEKLDEVFTILRTYYGKNFKLDRYIVDKKFTGSLPTDDLPQALYILQQTLNLEISYDGEKYLIQCER